MDNRIKKDSTFQYKFSFSQKDVENFAIATGDKNPIHLDFEYARRTIFKRPIIHGFLGGSVFSKVFGTMFPGEGTIYLKQNMSFYKPMYVDEDYKAVFNVIEVISEKHRAVVSTVIVDSTENILIKGEALIQHQLI